MSKLFIDFEFNSTSEPLLNVVCVAFQLDDGPIQSIWLQDVEGRQRFADLFELWVESDVTFVAFYAAAEARSLLGLEIDPTRVRWVDLWIEYRMLMNHSHELECGKQLIKGEVKHVNIPIPKWDRDDNWSSGGKAEVSLAACTYKLLGVQIDFGHKNETRDLIIHNMKWTLDEEIQILEYCESDIKYLPIIFKKIYGMLYSRYEPQHRESINAEILNRGDYAVATAKMEGLGYPLDYEATKAFADCVGDILFEMQCEVAKRFPNENPFLKHKTQNVHVQKKVKLQKWVEAQGHSGWTLTDKGALSLKAEAFEKFYDRNGDQTKFGNGFLRYLYQKKTLNGFSANSKKSIWDSVGSDERVRPYFGIFRAQSSRSQPGATGYILLKSKWMRVLLQPRPGKCIVAIDYSQQEFLIAAILSQDQNMLDAYASGDVYFHTAKLAGAVPKNAIRSDHEEVRDKFKSTVLGIQYLMGASGLATKLTNDLGVEHTEEDAQELISLFEESYPDYKAYRDQIWYDYQDQGYIRLNDGWTMWGDNENRRSVCNMPVQGAGAAVMRKAVLYAQEWGLDVTMTLHDALYIECDSIRWREDLLLLAKSMQDAFRSYFPNEANFLDCRQDETVWGPDFKEEIVDSPLGNKTKLYSKYIDPRGVEDYKKYRKFFIPKEDLNLLTSL